MNCNKHIIYMLYENKNFHSYKASISLYIFTYKVYIHIYKSLYIYNDFHKAIYKSLYKDSYKALPNVKHSVSYVRQNWQSSCTN